MRNSFWDTLGNRFNLRRVLNTNVLKGALKYTTANIVIRSIGFLLLPLWTRFLTPEDYGILGLMTTYSGILIPILMLGIDNGLFHRYHAYIDADVTQEEWRNYLSANVLFDLTVATVVIILISLAVSDNLWFQLTGGNIPAFPFKLIFMVDILLGVATGLGLVCLKAAEQHNRVVLFTCVQALSIQVFGLFLVAYWDLGAVGQLVGGLVGDLVNLLLVYGLFLRHQLKFFFQWRYVREAIIYGLPLVPHTMAFIVMNTSDRLMMSHYVPLDEIGLFSFAARVMVVFIIMVNSINQAWTPRYYAMMNKKQDALERVEVYATLWFGFMGLLIGGAILFAADLLQPLTTRDFHAIRPLLNPLALSVYFLGIYYLGANPMYYFKKTKILPIVTAIGAGINILLNLWLIPQFGAAGAAYGTAAAYSFIAICCLVYGHRLGGIRLPYRGALLLTFCLISIASLNYYLSTYDSALLFIRVGIFLALSSFIFLVFFWPKRTYLMQL